MTTQVLDTMPGLWVRVQSSLPRDPDVIRMAERLDLETAQAVGHMVMVWGAVAEHATNGDISRVSQRTLEEWAGWRGQAGAFDVAYRELFTDADGHVSRWFEYQGKLIERAEKAKAHMREVRSKAAAKRTPPAPAPAPTPAPEADSAITALGRTARKKTSPSAKSEEAPAQRTPQLTPIQRVFRKHRPKGAFVPGRVGNALKPLFDIGETSDQIADQLDLCMSVKFYSWEKFAEEYGTFVGKSLTRFRSREDEAMTDSYKASLNIDVVTAPAEDE